MFGSIYRSLGRGETERRDTAAQQTRAFARETLAAAHKRTARLVECALDINHPRTYTLGIRTRIAADGSRATLTGYRHLPCRDPLAEELRVYVLQRGRERWLLDKHAAEVFGFGAPSSVPAELADWTRECAATDDASLALAPRAEGSW